MAKYLLGVLMLLLGLTLCPSARAEILYGLAMSGQPKYGPDAPHLDYVNPDAPKGGTLRQAAVGTSFDSLNPFALKGIPAQGLDNVYGRLMQRVWDEPFTLYPSIAEKIDVPADRSAITFFLNPKARFSDGTPITADDVLFSYRTLLKEGRPNMQAIYKLVQTATRIDARTVQFKLSPGYSRETVMILAMMPVLSEKWWSGRKFDLSTSDIPLSNGPYKIAAVDPGRSITYERDKNYWAADLPLNRGLYNFDRITYTYFRNDSVALEAFLSGQLNYRREDDANKWAKSYNTPAVASGDIVKEAIPHHRTAQLNALVFNTRRPPFDDVHVREAIGLSLDSKWLNDNLFYGLYKQIDSYFPNSYLAAKGTPDAAELKLLDPFKASLPPSVFGPVQTPPPTGTPELMRENLRKADSLLKAAGWVVKNGVRVNAGTGKPLVFDILLGQSRDEKLALTFINGLKRLGIEASVRVLDSSAYTARMNAYDFDMTVTYWRPTLSPGTEQALYWGCAAAKQPARMNYAGICDPAIESILSGIANAGSRDDLIAHTRALDRILLAGHYIVPLFYPAVDFVAHARDIRRPAITPLYGMIVESWWENSKNPH